MNYDKLYKLAFDFKKVKLWEKVDEAEIFAVKLSDNRIGYITVTGMAGRVFMLAVYIGENAVQALLKMMFEIPYFFSNFEQREFMLMQDCLQCCFENKDYIGEEEASLVKDYAKKHRVKISGKDAYPFFWKYTPYRVPSKISSEDDAEDLCEALSAALEIAKRLKDGFSKEKIGLKKVSKRTKKIIMLENTDSGFKISKTDFPKIRAAKFPVPKCDNELAFTRLKTFENKIELECEIIRQMEPIVEEEGSTDAGFPAVMYAVNAKSYFVLPVVPVLFYEDNPDKLMDNFLQSLTKFEICPTAVKVINKQTYEFFKPFCEKLGIDMEYVSEPSDFMEEIQEKLEDNSDMDDDFEDAEMEEEQLEQFNQLLNGLLGVSRGNMSKEEFVDLLGSLGVSIPDDFSDNLNIIEDRSKTADLPDNVISLDSKRKKSSDIVSDTAYVISVSVYKGCYRHIKISGDSTLFDLHLAIIDAFDFYDDHLHVFFMDNKIWSKRESYYDERASESGYTTSEITLEELELSVGKQFKYVFDFGDEWLLQCKVLKRLNEPNVKTQIIKSIGESPEQYPEYDEDWDEDYDDFDPEIFEQ